MQRSQLFRKKSTEDIISQLKEDALSDGSSLSKILTVRDLTFLGIAAIIGAGIFSTVGKACFDGGPGVILLFIITAIACGFSAFCYADFASRIPVSGSAYTYSYAAFGELVAWIIGWDLIMEYAIGNITVAISWSGNLSSFLSGLNIHIPDYLATSFMAAEKGHAAFLDATMRHQPISDFMRSMEQVWTNAPTIAGIPVVLNLPALLITAFITYVVFKGIKESRASSNFMVVFKLVVIILIIIIGFFYVNPSNWHPFLPNGFSGVMKGVSAVFFAYIGFDAISTTAEECKNPQRDLPRGMVYSLIICTGLYVLIALVLTGMVPYTQLAADDFLAHAFNERGLSVLGGIIALSAVIATTSVLLVFQIGQPRIWMSMSRDGLLPKRFGKIHPKYKTPAFASIIAGILVGVPAVFLDSDLVTDLTSIGTLFAFILVCGGILVLPRQEKVKGKFRVPFFGSRFIAPLFLIITISLSLMLNYDNVIDFYNARKIKEPLELVQSLNPAHQILMSKDLKIDSRQPDLILPKLAEMSEHDYRNFIRNHDAEFEIYDSGWDVFKHQIPFHIFIIIGLFMTALCIVRNLSLIPVMGLISCLYLMTELGATNWARFFVWLALGLIVYFGYSYHNSRLRKKDAVTV